MEKKFIIFIITILALNTLFLPVSAHSNGWHLSESYSDMPQTALEQNAEETPKPTSIQNKTSQDSIASLSQQDHNDLYESLLILSNGWDQFHVERANSILIKPNYSTEDWVEFFNGFFLNNPFTEDLRNYLAHPTLFWFGHDVNLKLQLGLIPAMMINITSIIGNHHESLGAVLSTNSDLRETLFRSLRMINEIARFGVINHSTRQAIADVYSDLVSSYPKLFLKSVSVDTKQPYVGAVRAQLYMNIGDTLPLDQSRKAEIASTLNITDIYLQIWNTHSVLVIDNNGLSTKQLTTIDNYLRSLPVGIHNLRYITVNSLLGNEDPRYQWFNHTERINIFNLEVGVFKENGFPADVAPKFSDIFSLVLAHEVNHIVECYSRNTNIAWANRQRDLLNAAGDYHMSYLRSIFEDGFFTKYPQEFFASIANQYFSDSARTFELGLVRMEKGYHEPINQFLFFTETYSQGGSTTPFYSIDENGVLSKTMIPVSRDSRGRINRLVVNGVSYEFNLDSNGNVIDVEVQPIPNQIFADVPEGYWAFDWILRLHAAGVTSGCSEEPPLFCPDNDVTRAEMAVFLLRGLNGPGYVPPASTGTLFGDVPAGYWALGWIEQLHAEEITVGCSVEPLLYCPQNPVTRAEMAVFLLRSKYGKDYTPPEVSKSSFDDVPDGYWALNWIEQLYADGITGGCGEDPLLYCPEQSVTRAQMAVFLVRNFELP